jgi:hypothetical protein
VQDFTDRFQTLACHAPGVTARQRTELLIGGLPNQIRVNVEMRDPQDLQLAMYYTRAYEQRALAMQQSFQGQGARPPPFPISAAPASTRPTVPAAPATLSASMHPFCCLTSAEQLEWRYKGLCFNCDEIFAPGHVCARLFYLETVDDGEVEALTMELDTMTLFEAGVTTYGPSPIVC